jgi:hypothetical protein
MPALQYPEFTGGDAVREKVDRFVLVGAGNRAPPDFESEGRRFESVRARHLAGTSSTSQNLWLFFGSAKSLLRKRCIICLADARG